MLTATQIRELVDYSPDTGALTFKQRPLSMFGGTSEKMRQHLHRKWNNAHAGKPALTSKSSDGYLVGEILGRQYSAHRVAWAAHYGEWPKMIDHANGNRSDNRISNLRPATYQENSRNSRAKAGSTSAYRGVSFDSVRNKWVASIMVDGRRIFLGRHSTEDDAAKAYATAAKRHFGVFTQA